MAQISWKIFKDHNDYTRGMDRFLQLANSDLTPGTDDYDEFEMLNLLIGHYENKNYSIETPDPIEAIKFRMDQEGLSQADMTQFIGPASKVSEVLNRKRPLSLSMIRRIHDGLGIPADILIQDMSAIEWNLVDVVEKEVNVTGKLLQFCTAIMTPGFDRVFPEHFVAAASLSMSPQQKRNTDPKRGETGMFKQLTELGGYFTAPVYELSEELQIDRDFSLIS
ncbi:transcriptional regulator [Serratia grimesii]|uniref:Transcriptional regulator n=1 Tax=Serratia grimesii TaxID=82995 RepID=A0ABR4UBM0_9GAMM|nr:transcriptional regulator [Serratia grimesii]